MITQDQAATAEEFHYARDGQPCQVWHRAEPGVRTMPGGGWLVFIETTAKASRDRDWWHITSINADGFHTVQDCPLAPAETPTSQNNDGPDLFASLPRDETGYDAYGYDADGYDRDGYDDDDKDRFGRPRPVDVSDLDLAELWEAFTPKYWHRIQDEFREHLRTLVTDPDDVDGDIAFCAGCEEPCFTASMNSVQGGYLRICDSCWDDWVRCDSCHEKYPSGDMAETLGGSDVCESCRSGYCTWCDYCDGYYWDDDADEHYHGSDGDGCCDSPQPEFKIRNDGCEPLANGTRVTIELPAGVISDEGLAAIRSYLRGAGHFDLSYDLDQLGSEWQTRQGNYAKRLSRLAYQHHQEKLTPQTLSQVGVIAREHSNAVSVEVEVSRDLNASASEWYHGGSCYWGEYYESRCALKTNGGFGLRSWNRGSYSPSGRAWVIPLRLNDGRLVPTFETLEPDAFVVFNGYGDLEGYAAPRILAHMAGWTYRKIGFSAEPMYINAGGYLIAPEHIAEQYTDSRLTLYIDQHSSLFEDERQPSHA